MRNPPIPSVSHHSFPFSGSSGRNASTTRLAGMVILVGFICLSSMLTLAWNQLSTPNHQLHIQLPFQTLTRHHLRVQAPSKIVIQCRDGWHRYCCATHYHLLPVCWCYGLAASMILHPRFSYLNKLIWRNVEALIMHVTGVNRKKGKSCLKKIIIFFKIHSSSSCLLLVEVNLACFKHRFESSSF